MPLNIVLVSDVTQLFANLRELEITVPLRTCDRTTDHTETYTAARLLSTLAAADQLEFQLTVIHSDRPDLLLKSADTKIGIEVTEAISTQYAKYCALAEREFPNVFLEPAHFRWGAPDMTNNQMRKLLSQDQLSSLGWTGDRPEREWAFYIQSIVDTKLAKLTHSDFAKFDFNWLAVYDNLPLQGINLAKAISMLCPLLQDYWSRNPSFDALFIESGAVITRITAHGSVQIHINDLWR